MNRLWIKLLAAFGVVILIGVIVTVLVARQAAVTQLSHFMVGNQMVRPAVLQQVVGNYYTENDGWDGIDAHLQTLVRSASDGGAMGGMMGGMMGMGETYIMSRQAHFIEAEVDVETGMVFVTNVVCVNDVGHIFNRRGCEGQQYGGAIMGLGKSATEEKVYCPKTGVGLNLDHINYHLGTMNDYPEVQCLLNESHLGYGPYGSNGIGENIGASMAAITSSAIYNATGKWVLDYPITPDKVLKTLETI